MKLIFIYLSIFTFNSFILHSNDSINSAVDSLTALPDATSGKKYQDASIYGFKCIDPSTYINIHENEDNFSLISHLRDLGYSLDEAIDIYSFCSKFEFKYSNILEVDSINDLKSSKIGIYAYVSNYAWKKGKQDNCDTLPVRMREKTSCISLKTYEWMCKNMSGVTQGLVESVDSDIGRILFKNGGYDGFKNTWDEQSKNCNVEVKLIGSYKGTSYNKYFGFPRSVTMFRYHHNTNGILGHSY